MTRRRPACNSLIEGPYFDLQKIGALPVALAAVVLLTLGATFALLRRRRRPYGEH